jgi:hypothetical protein
MIDRKINDLINKEIDGSNSPEETARLKACLKNNVEGQREYDRLGNLAHMLSSVDAVDPPASMKARIMNSVERRRSAEPKKTSIFEYLSRKLQPRAALRLGYAFSIGLAVGVLMYTVYLNIHNDVLGTSDASGTIGMGESPDKLESGDSFDVTLPQVRASVAVKYLRTIPLLNVHLSSVQNVTTDIAFDARTMRVRAVQQFNDPKSSITIRAGEVSISSNGSNEYSIFFAHEMPSTTPIRLSISASGALLYEKTVSFAGNQARR